MSKLMMDPLHNGRKEVPAPLGSCYASIDSGVKPEPKKKKPRAGRGWDGQARGWGVETAGLHFHPLMDC